MMHFCIHFNKYVYNSRVFLLDGWFVPAEPVPCREDLCRNFGICTNTPIGVFSCQCQHGYTGLFCELSTTTAYSNPIPLTGLSFLCINFSNFTFRVVVAIYFLYSLFEFIISTMGLTFFLVYSPVAGQTS